MFAAEHFLNQVVKTKKIKMYWNQSIIKKKKIKRNKSDIVLTLKEQRAAFIIDIASPNSFNLQEKTTETLHTAEELKRNV